MKLEQYIWQIHPVSGKDEECLMIADLDECDECGNPTFTNGVWVGPSNPINASYIKKAMLLADNHKKEYGIISETSMNESCECFCEKCYRD